MFPTGLLQAWGGIFFLLNKAFLALAEQRPHETAKRWWRVVAWMMYLVGLPGWLVIFVYEHNWIVMAVELGGVPGVLYALVSARRGKNQASRWLRVVVLGSVVIGISVSVYDFGGLTTFNQFLELMSNTGLLIGTYLLAQERATGFLWYVLMNSAMGVLMFRQGYTLLCTQQFASLFFVALGYYIYRRKRLR
jgi:hypothetical protein